MYMPNGLYNAGDQKRAEAMSLNTNNFKDKRISGVSAHLIEEVRIKQSDGSYKLYEYDWGNSESAAYKELAGEDNQKRISKSDPTGKYELKSMIPGIYKTRFYYGHESEEGSIGDQQLKYNGQDLRNDSDEIELNRKAYDFEIINNLFNKLTYLYKIHDIDFGIEYRPKNAISLNKYISGFKVILENKTVLADVIFDEVYDDTTHANKNHIEDYYLQLVIMNQKDDLV